MRASSLTKSNPTKAVVVRVAETFRPVRDLGAGEPVALVVKGITNVDGLRTRRHVERLRAEQQGQITFQPLRPTDEGGFVALLSFGSSLQSATGRQDGVEARGFAQRRELTVIAFANELRLVRTSDGGVIKTIRHPEFGNLHTVHFCPTDPDRVLISSFGFDRLLEMDLTTEKVTWRWLAWSHGYGRNALGLRLIARGDDRPAGDRVKRLTHAEAAALMTEGQAVPCGEEWVLEVDVDRVTHPLGLENWQKVAQPNWAAYSKTAGKILATFFNMNEAVEIDRQTGAVRVLIQELAKPHGIIPYADGYVISDTAHGRVLQLDDTFAVSAIYDFSGFALSEGAKERPFEWIQYTQAIGDGSLLATVDVRRATIIVWDPETQTYSRYPYPQAWAVQSVLPALLPAPLIPPTG